MLKIADIYVSNDGCGPYVLKLIGIDSLYFEIIGKEVYFKDHLAITPKIYNASVILTDLSGTIIKVIRPISADRRNCIYTTTTLAPAITSTTTTQQPPINPLCQSSIILSPVINGATGSWAGCGIFSSPYYTNKVCASTKPISSVSFDIQNIPYGIPKDFEVFIQFSKAMAYSDYKINIDIVKNTNILNLRSINNTESYINIFRTINGTTFQNPKLIISFIQLGSITRSVCIEDLRIRANIVAVV